MELGLGFRFDFRQGGYFTVRKKETSPPLTFSVA
jgi:hypothetical protein